MPTLHVDTVRQLYETVGRHVVGTGHQEYTCSDDPNQHLIGILCLVCETWWLAPVPGPGYWMYWPVRLQLRGATATARQDYLTELVREALAGRLASLELASLELESLEDRVKRLEPRDLSAWYPGRQVRIKTSLPTLPTGETIDRGVIVQHRPAHKGFMVRPDGLMAEFGWDYEELELLPIIVGPSVWERLAALRALDERAAPEDSTGVLDRSSEETIPCTSPR